MHKQLLLISAVLIILFAAVAGYLLLSQPASPTTVVVQRPVTLPAQAANLDALRAKAEAGDAAAQTSLGWIYQKGVQVKPDMKAAVQWFRRAADQTNVEAIVALGEMNQAG